MDGDRFDYFPCTVCEAAAFYDSCQYCVDDQIRGRIMCGASDDEAARRMFEVRLDPAASYSRYLSHM